MLVLFLAETAYAQQIKTNYQISLLGLQETKDESQSQGIAVVVSNRTVIRHFKSAPKQIEQLKRTFGNGGKCGCGK